MVFQAPSSICLYAFIVVVLFLILSPFGTFIRYLPCYYLIDFLLSANRQSPTNELFSFAPRFGTLFWVSFGILALRLIFLLPAFFVPVSSSFLYYLSERIPIQNSVAALTSELLRIYVLVPFYQIQM